MISACCSRVAAKHKYPVIAAIFFALAASTLHATDWCLLLQPKYLKPEAAWSIPEAKDTVLVPHRIVDGLPLPLTKKDLVELKPTPKEIEESALQCSISEEKLIEPRYVRDAKGVIDYAVIESERPLVSTSLMAPAFAQRFAETLGPDLLVAVPTQNLIFVFPKLSPSYQGMTDVIIAEFQSSPAPGSRELFEIIDGRLRALGSYR